MDTGTELARRKLEGYLLWLPLTADEYERVKLEAQRSCRSTRQQVGLVIRQWLTEQGKTKV
jgi:hypothetical protein